MLGFWPTRPEHFQKVPVFDWKTSVSWKMRSSAKQTVADTTVVPLQKVKSWFAWRITKSLFWELGWELCGVSFCWKSGGHMSSSNSRSPQIPVVYNDFSMVWYFFVGIFPFQGNPIPVIHWFNQYIRRFSPVKLFWLVKAHIPIVSLLYLRYLGNYHVYGENPTQAPLLLPAVMMLVLRRRFMGWFLQRSISWW